jgi:hypothetical protein
MLSCSVLIPVPLLRENNYRQWPAKSICSVLEAFQDGRLLSIEVLITLNVARFKVHGKL